MATAVTALLGGVWIIAATDPTLQAVLRGPIGNLLAPVVRPLMGSVRLGEAVEITNTRFIVGYNGLADLCLVAIFASGAVLLGRPRLGGRSAGRRSGCSRAGSAGGDRFARRAHRAGRWSVRGWAAWPCAGATRCCCWSPRRW